MGFVAERVSRQASEGCRQPGPSRPYWQGTAGGTPVERPLAAGLVTGDGATVYRVDDGIPVMLPGLGIAAGRLRRG